jgi:hypothetical protein
MCRSVRRSKEPACLMCSKRTVIERPGLAEALYTRIREVLGSSLGRDTDYRDRFFVVFLGPFREMPG